MNVVEAPAQSLVVDEGAVHIVAMNTPFIAKDHFVLGEGDAIRIAFMARNFERMFLEKEEENFQGSTLKYGGLVQKCVDPRILKSLGGKEVAGISLAEFFNLLANPKDLHRDGKMNLCFIPDVSNTLRTVVCIRLTPDSVCVRLLCRPSINSVQKDVVFFTLIMFLYRFTLTLALRFQKERGSFLLLFIRFCVILCLARKRILGTHWFR